MDDQPDRVSIEEEVGRDENDSETSSVVGIPELDNDTKFSFRKLWAFAGPGFLMSIACLDPGNIDSDLQAGGYVENKLLWVLLLAHVLCLLLNRMSARLGVVTGKDMAEIAREYYSPLPRYVIWIMVEISIICTDMQEVIGTAIAFFLLSNQKIPLFAGVLLTVLDTFTFMTVERRGIRKLELFFAILIASMALSFGFEYFVEWPNPTDVAKGIVIPWCKGCESKQLILGLSLLGATLQPSNFYLYSALVKSRNIDRKRRYRIAEANMYNFVESSFALTVSFIINLFVIAVFASGIYKKSNQEIRVLCDKHPSIPDPNVFPHDNQTVNVDVYKAGVFLGCKFGPPALYIWAIGILAAGQSSTMCGTYSGQFVMEGFVRIALPKWQRVLLTRSIAILPTLALVLFASGQNHGIDKLTGMNDILNVLQMIQLPFALIPIITFTAAARIMHDFKMSRPFLMFSMVTSLFIIGVNVYFIQDYVKGLVSEQYHIFAYLGLALPTILYILFVLYLAIICLTECDLINTMTVFGHKLRGNFESDAPWLYRPIEDMSEHLLRTAY